MTTMWTARKHLENITEDIIDTIPVGRYAWQPDELTPLIFLHLKRYTYGKRNGQTRVRTQHGPNYQEALTINPPGNATTSLPFYLREHILVLDNQIEDALLGVFCDRFGTAQRYAQELNVCARCALELTVTRSRWYGIGPECEGYWAWYIEEFDNRKGFTFEERNQYGIYE